jgi:surface antigen
MSVLRLAWLGPLLVCVSCSGAEPEGDPIGVISQAWTAEPCGAVLATYDGTAAKSNGGNTGTGSSCGGTGTYGLQYQCVELVMRHWKTHWNLRFYGNAKDLLAHAKSSSYYASGSPADVEVWNNGDATHPPKAGDMIVWTSGTYGHVALITNVTSSTVDIIEQNVSGVTPQGKYTLKYDGKTVAGRWSQPGPAGWIHAKKNAAAAGDTGVADTAPADTGAAAKDSGTIVEDSATIADSATLEDAADPPEGVGDPIVAPANDTQPAEDTALEGGCAYGTSAGGGGWLVVLLAALIVRRRS